MAQQYDNTDKGVLFKNEEKESDNQPDYKGRINTGGTDFWLSAWIKTAKDGRKFMSLSATAMEGKPAPKKARDGGASKMDSDIPF
jgi:uncharacterized protein (DUF736 family)